MDGETRGGAPHETQRNSIEGQARISGAVVQAQQVHGGVHVYPPAPPPGPAPVPVPRQLPPVPGHFVNRRRELAALDAVLSRHMAQDAGAIPLIVVNGPAGVGKTTFAARWLGGRAADFPGGQLYADLRGHTAEGAAAPGEVLGRFLRALGAGSVPADLAEQMSEWRSRSAELKVAVLLDNALSAAQIRPLLPAGPGSVAVVTSRRRLTGLNLDGADFHRLEVFDAADGVELLRLGIGADRVAGEPAATRRVVDLCGGLPLAVRLASARLASRPRQPVAALAAALAPDADGLAALDVEGETTVSKALDASYSVLGQDAALLYRRLGQLPLATFDVPAAAAACARPPHWADDRLDELVEANLLEMVGPEGFRFHDLVRVHARTLGAADTADGGPGTTLRRVCDWYLHTTTAAEARLTPAQLHLPRDYVHPPQGLPVPFADDLGATRWLDAHRLDLMTLLRTAADRGWHAYAWQLADAMWPLVLRLRHYDLWIEAYDIGLAAARADGHERAVRQMLTSGAIGLNAMRRYDAAVARYEDARVAARDAGDIRDEGQALLGIGRSHREAGRPAEARPYLEQAIALWEACGYVRGTGLARTVLGEAALAAGEPVRAAAYFARARQTHLAVDDPHDAARNLAFLGRAKAMGGEQAAGVAHMEEALGVFTASGATHWQARTLEMLGDSAYERGDHPAAAELHSQALACYELTNPDDANRLRQLLATRTPGGPE
ncbi:tetratricopeptide repeat protein [Actinacidiphila epipremni]|uniref:tetratricopeptide repeat protein n=1 Tax=Actinacidiphila epipremni TaxID=2053013 RepID=UPI002AFDDFCD|nr:tetratricopeptide repeat protein [Actinacidiphila epipremni]